MIGYVCKYTPIHILKFFDQDVMRIDPSIYNFNKSDTLMHPNMCFYAKAVLEYCTFNNIDKIVLVNCCDSIRRLYDVLTVDGNFDLVYIIDLPRKDTCCCIELFKNELLQLIKTLEDHSSKKFNLDTFKDIIKSENKILKPSNTQYNSFKNKNINIALSGARCKDSILEFLENSGGHIKYNFTCTGDTVYIDDPPKNIDILKWYSKNLLQCFPCLRMVNTQKRYNILNENKNNIDGILYHTVKFCDFYSYEYSMIKDKIDKPILKIETDYTKQSEGQMKTRIEAFLESIKNKITNSKTLKVSKKTTKNIENLFIMGIDSGSTSTNVVILDENKKILSYSVVRTGSKSSIGIEKATKIALEKINLNLDDISYIVATGYGRVSIPFSQKIVTEITCHAKGANFLNPNIRTIIDIGGQDSKAIKIDKLGNVLDFSMNDKCAAGTGRFLEMMSKTLEIPIEQMGEESLKWKEDIPITSMCSVFAESEVISLIANNKEKSDIIHGLSNSIASRTISLVNRIKGEGKYMMTGGVAKNIGVVNSLSEGLKQKIYIPTQPEIIGALGAAIIGVENLVNKV